MDADCHVKSKDFLRKERRIFKQNKTIDRHENVDSIWQIQNRFSYLLLWI